MLANGFMLRSGTKMPIIGLGTYQNRDFKTVYDSVFLALQIGYRHIDTAEIYQNEEAIGKAISDSGISRDQLFIVSKAAPYSQGYEQAKIACQRSLNKLGLDYLDLYLIHWPGVSKIAAASPKNAELRRETWRAFEELKATGKCKEIGVSNYQINHLEEMVGLNGYANEIPAVNQVELHPFLPQFELHEYCKQKQIQIEAYTSLGQGDLINNEIVQRIAIELNRTNAQVLLKWAIQKQIPVIPKSATSTRIIENFNIFDFNLTDQQLLILNSIPKRKRYCWNPESIL
eukprot:TRINITY_DN3679_c1_g1_i1.p1 TRINITY_DN3679_c1_g1~~TRINITY_DN3679_c1_g1_i1.p1  ORF type:complete len:314 (-),score=138.50 TRINITY_DN3679_c1_g1_i1:19-879(-)